MDKKPRGGAGRGQGRKPVGTPDDPICEVSVILRESDIAYLRTINAKNLSAAIRSLIVKVREG